MTEHDATIQDLQRSVDELRQDRDRWKTICYSLAKYHAKDADKTVFEIIEDEARWIDQQATWAETGNL